MGYSHHQIFNMSGTPAVTCDEAVDSMIGLEYEAIDAGSNSGKKAFAEIANTRDIDPEVVIQPVHSQFDHLVGMSDDVHPAPATTLPGALPTSEGGAKILLCVDSSNHIHPRPVESSPEASSATNRSDCWAMEPSSPVDSSPPHTVVSATHVPVSQNPPSHTLSHPPAPEEHTGPPFLEVAKSLLVSVDILVEPDGFIHDQISSNAITNTTTENMSGMERRERVVKHKATLSPAYDLLSQDKMEKSESTGRDTVSSQGMTTTKGAPGSRNPSLMSYGSRRQLSVTTPGLRVGSSMLLPSPPHTSISSLSRLSHSSGGSRTSSAPLSSFRRASLAVLASSHSSTLGRSRTPSSTPFSVTAQQPGTILQTGLLGSSLSISKLGSFSAQKEDTLVGHSLKLVKARSMK
jgi:hypothetical protein